MAGSKTSQKPLFFRPVTLNRLNRPLSGSLSINVQGVTGKKKDFTSLPYSKIQAFSVETAGFLDTDCELEMWFSGLGKVKIEFINTLNISEICKLISEKVL